MRVAATRCLLLSTALASLAVVASSTALCQTAHSSLERCSVKADLWLAVPTTMERVPSSHPSVLCAFRDKNEGFPSFNAIVEPQRTAAEKLTQDQWAKRAVESYHSIGLTDATVDAYLNAPATGERSFSAIIRYTNHTTPMKAIVAEVDEDDRAYTLTALDRSEHFAESRQTLEALIANVQVQGAENQPTGSAMTPSKESRPLAILVILTICTIVAAYRLNRGKRN